MLPIKLPPPAFGFATVAVATAAATVAVAVGISLCFILLCSYLALAPFCASLSTAYLPTVIILVVALNQSVVYAARCVSMQSDRADQGGQVYCH